MTNNIHRDLAWLAQRIRDGSATPHDKDRFRFLLGVEIAPEVERTVLERLPAVRRRIAQQQERQRQAQQWARQQNTPRRR